MTLLYYVESILSIGGKKTEVKNDKINIKKNEKKS
jgi:hypothetical protein